MRRFPFMPTIHLGITLLLRFEHLSILFLMQCAERQPNDVNMWPARRGFFDEWEHRPFGLVQVGQGAVRPLEKGLALGGVQPSTARAIDQPQAQPLLCKRSVWACGFLWAAS